MSDPHSIERLLVGSSSTALASAVAGVHSPRMHYGGGAPVLSDDELRPLLLDYAQRQLAGMPRTGIDAIFADHEPFFREQGSLPLGVHLRHSVFSEHRTLPYDLDVLESQRSDIASLARFSHRVDYANFHFCAALGDDEDPRAWRKQTEKRVRIHFAPKSYLAHVAAESFKRWQNVRAILVHARTPSREAEPLCRAGFWSLCELTPADSQLKHLFAMNPVKACQELVRHVDVVAEQLAMAAQLADDLSTEDTAATESEDAARLDAVQNAILDKAGERLSLTEAARRLGTTRQNLHKRIKSGSAIGVMIGSELVIPSAQLVSGDDRVSIVANLRDVLSLFTAAGAGTWSALQFLVEPDPVLGGIPLEQLREGEVAPVVAAARAYLGLDDG